MHISGSAAGVVGFLLVTGCAQNPIPEGYRGPTARIVDTIEPQGEHSAYIFYVEEVDGRRIDNASAWATRANSGNGLSLRLYSVEFGRNVPAAPAAFKVVGYIHYPAPIQTLFNRTGRVSGTINFTPEPDGDYIVTGKLNDDHPAVWIEDAHSHKVAGEKVQQ